MEAYKIFNEIKKDIIKFDVECFLSLIAMLMDAYETEYGFDIAEALRALAGLSEEVHDMLGKIEEKENENLTTENNIFKVLKIFQAIKEDALKLGVEWFLPLIAMLMDAYEAEHDDIDFNTVEALNALAELSEEAHGERYTY